MLFSFSGLLRLQTDVSQPINSCQFFINIYNEKAKRFVCFTHKGKVRTLVSDDFSLALSLYFS